MNDQDLEKALEGTADSGNPEEAIARGGGVGVVARRKRKRLFSYLIPLVSVAMAISIAVPLTWYYAKKTSLPDDTGAGGSNDPIAYLKDFSRSYYPYPIPSLTSDTLSYGEIYYGWNSASDENLVFHLFLEKASSLEIKDGTTSLLFSRFSNSHLALSGFTIAFTPVVKDLSGATIILNDLSLNLAPFYNAIVNGK